MIVAVSTLVWLNEKGRNASRKERRAASKKVVASPVPLAQSLPLSCAHLSQGEGERSLPLRGSFIAAYGNYSNFAKKTSHCPATN
jgi:hypothetical protein